ncbi:MAG: hypothetical protein K0R57_6136 [Paenibacillaceae bacterium]|jgi:AraC-like DNA-binding protein|nr:hypothetical protein [Paenibacillaceae bacterium]
MKILRRINRFYRQKWIVFALLFSTIPILVFGLFMYVTGTRIVEEEIENASLSSISQLKEQVDIIISQVEQFSAQYGMQSNATELMKIGQSPSLRSMLLVNDLNEDLSAFVGSMKALHSAYLYHIPQQLLITNTIVTSLRPEDQVDYTGSFRDLSWIEGIKTAAAARQQEYWILPRYVREGQEESRALTYVRLLPLFYNEPKAALVVNVRADFIGQIIRSFPLNTEGALLVFSKEGALITMTGNTKGVNAGVLERLTELHYDAQDQESGRRSTGLKLDGRDVVVTADRSQKQGWTYVMLVPSDAASENVERLRQIVIVTTLALSLLAGIMAFFSFQRFRKGMTRLADLLFNRGPKTSPAEQNGAWTTGQEDLDHFQRMEHRIANLFDEVDEVREQWKEQLPLLRSHFLLSVLLGHHRSLERLAQTGARDMHVFPHRRFCLLIIEMDDNGDNARFRREDQDLFLYAAANIANELFADMCTVETVLTRKQAVVVMNYPEDWREEEPVRKADMLRGAIARFLKQTATIVVGKSKDSLDQLSPTFFESQIAFQWLHGGNQVVLGQAYVNPDQVAVYPGELEQQIMDLLVEGRYEPACEALRLLFRYMEESKLPAALQKNYSLQLLVSVMRLIQKYENEEHKAFPDRNPYGELLLLENGQQALQWFESDLLLPAVSFLMSLKHKHVREAITQVLQIIDSHYKQDLSLQLAADLVKMNAYQLSKLFKEQMGENFIHYVTRYRVDKIKELLVETELTISQIAAAVGYNNSQQLIRVFKKVENITPGEYRTANGRQV